MTNQKTNTLAKECPLDKVIIQKIGMPTTIIYSEITDRPKIILENPTEVLEKYGYEVSRLCYHIQSLTPFECDNFLALLMAIKQQYSTNWRIQLNDILDYIGMLGASIKNKYKGSWNCPIKYITDDSEYCDKSYYKVLRKTNSPIEEYSYAYEFHQSYVPLNMWIQAEISSSKNVCGLKNKDDGGSGGKFHLLLDYLQAQEYLSKRIDNTWFPKEVAEIVPVRARKFQTIDLIYVPPTTFVWGIDSEEMFVKYESVTV